MSEVQQASWLRLDRVFTHIKLEVLPSRPLNALSTSLHQTEKTRRPLALILRMMLMDTSCLEVSRDAAK